MFFHQFVIVMLLSHNLQSGISKFLFTNSNLEENMILKFELEILTYGWYFLSVFFSVGNNNIQPKVIKWCLICKRNECKRNTECKQ